MWLVVFASLFAAHGMNVVRVDISQTGIATANNACQSPRLTFKFGDTRDLKWSNEFDHVYPGARVYFSLRFDIILPGQLALTANAS